MFLVDDDESTRMKKTVTIRFIMAILMLSFSSCVRFLNWECFDFFHRYDNCYTSPTKLVGIWSAKDGATIELNKDGTCSLRNVQRIIEYTACSGGEDTSSVWNYSGYWRVEPELSFYKGRKDTIGFKVYLDNRSPFDVEWEKGDCEVRLRIHNEKVSKDIVPVLLYNFIGDPDNFETYDFYKL